MFKAMGSWPPTSEESQEWFPDPLSRGSRADRLLGTYRSAIPPLIAKETVSLSRSARDAVKAAQYAADRLRETTRADLSALAGALLRSESVASSKIERLSVRHDEVALAVFGVAPGQNPRRVRAAAQAVAANISAMNEAINTPGVALDLHDIASIHRLLLQHDPHSANEAGALRTVQNWIGGSDFSPRGALFVPPKATRIRGMLDDLVAFMRRGMEANDIGPVELAAISHAQFETIHPFVDGNGRTGRALIHSLWRRTGFTRSTVIPVSAVLLTDVVGYFDGLTAYRRGDLDGWVIQFAAATASAATAAQDIAERIDTLREAWIDATKPRKGSAASFLIRAALQQPVFTFDTMRAAIPVSPPAFYSAIDKLATAGIIVEVTGQGRNRVWCAPDVFALLEDFDTTLGARGRPDTG